MSVVRVTDNSYNLKERVAETRLLVLGHANELTTVESYLRSYNTFTVYLIDIATNPAIATLFASILDKTPNVLFHTGSYPTFVSESYTSYYWKEPSMTAAKLEKYIAVKTKK